MKDVEELAWTSANITAIETKVIAATIEEVARREVLWTKFYKENRDLVGKGKPASISFPRQHAGIAFTVGVGYLGTAAATESTYSATTFTVTKIGGELRIPVEVIEEPMRDVIKDQITEAGEVYAQTIDFMAFEAMFPSASTTPAGASTFGVGKSIIGIKSVADASKLSSIAPYEGSMVVSGANTITYWYVPDTCAGTVDAGGTLSAKDILLAKNKVTANYYHPDVFAIGEERLPELLYDSTLKFLDVAAFGNRKPISDAVIGRIFGMEAYATREGPQYGGVVIDTKKLGYRVIKDPLEAHREEKWDVYGLYFHLWARETVGVLNNDAYAAAVISGWRAYPEST